MIGTALALRAALRARPGLTLVAFGAIAALCALSWCWGLAVGRSGIAPAVDAERLIQAKAKTEALQQAHDEFREQTRQGDLASQDLRKQLSTREQQLSTLRRSLANAPQLLATAACPQPGDVRLSVGAVRLYDSALNSSGAGMGTDSQRAAGAPAAASAAGAASEVTVSVFQDVAQANAERFGECVIRFNKLRAAVCAKQQCN